MQSFSFVVRDRADLDKKADAQTCCVCGTSTNRRCGPCSEAGTDLFFCSKEHQKLIWPNHKRVCGAASNPFSFPPFNDDEVRLLRNLKSARKPEGPDHEDLTLASALTSVLLLPKDQVIERAPKLLQDPTVIHPAIRQYALSLPRSAMYELATRPREVAHFGSLNAFYHVAHFQYWVWSKAHHLTPLSFETKHRAVVLFSLASYEAMSPPPSSYDRKLLCHAFTSLVHSLVRGKSFSKTSSSPAPLAAHEVLKGLRDLLQPITALGFFHHVDALSGEVVAFQAYHDDDGEAEIREKMKGGPGDSDGFFL
ncbi:hypothetical protein JCM6882_007564 [Rhodosporidiobolus microsporus]